MLWWSVMETFGSLPTPSCFEDFEAGDRAGGSSGGGGCGRSLSLSLRALDKEPVFCL